MMTVSLVINLTNIVKLLRLWYVWRKIINTAEAQRRNAENTFNTLFTSRQGYNEARQEIEAAGIQSVELDEIQRMEWNNARQLLSQFGAQALQNINMLRLILNIDGERRNPEDTDEHRVILYSRIKTLVYEKEKHGHADSCSIC